MYYVGLDVHYRTSTYCILNANGREIKCETIRGHWPKLLDRLAALKEPWTVCFEATCGYGYLHRELSHMASSVIVAHPAQLRLIFRSKRKNDRVDARKLAKLLYLDEVPQVYIPGQEVQSWRELIEHRCRVVNRQASRKNALRSLLRSHGVVAPEGLWSKNGLTWLRQLKMPTAASRLKRDLLLEELAEAQRGVRILTQALNKIGRRHPGVVLLRTIPGVGPRTAETIVAYIDEPKRFRSGSQVAAYFRLVPCQDAE